VGRQARLDGGAGALRGRIGAVRAGVERHQPDRLPGLAGLRRRADLPADADPGRQGRGWAAQQPPDRHGQFAAGARADSRPGGRRCDPQLAELALAVPGQHACDRRRPGARLAAPAPGSPGSRCRPPVPGRDRARAARTGVGRDSARPVEPLPRRRDRPHRRTRPAGGRGRAVGRVLRLGARTRRPSADRRYPIAAAALARDRIHRLVYRRRSDLRRHVPTAALLSAAARANRAPCRAAAHPPRRRLAGRALCGQQARRPARSPPHHDRQLPARRRRDRAVRVGRPPIPACGCSALCF
jgi:hypothetical protein